MNRLLLLLFILVGSFCQAQYRGGTEDGISSFNSPSQNASPNIYQGGNNDGFSFQQTANLNPSPSIFLGGNNDGWAAFQNTGLNPSPSIYTGGINDGFSQFTALLSNPLPNIFNGGNDDGFSALISLAQNPGPSIYRGGNDDGFSSYLANLENMLANIYLGGPNDGFATIQVNNRNPLVVLPVRLMEFTGRWVGDDVQLDWRTASENKNSHFDIERSDDGGQTFHRIGTVNGNGTTNSISSYGYLDQTVRMQPGTVFYYRLRPTDIDGRFTYSAIIRLSRNQKEITYTLYPNPTSGEFTVAISGVTRFDGYRYEIFTANGNAITKGQISNSHTQMNISNYSAGVYWMRILEDNKAQSTIKIVLTK